MHFFEVGVPVEGGVAAQEEVGDYAYGPDVAAGWSACIDLEGTGWGIHWLAVAGLLENLRGHVARCAARCGEHMKRFLVHDPAEAEVGNEEVGVVFWCSEEEVLRLEIPMHDAVVVEVGYG